MLANKFYGAALAALLVFSGLALAGQGYLDPVDGSLHSLPDNIKAKTVAMGSPTLAVSTNTTLTPSQMRGYRITLTGDGTVLTLADSDETTTGSCIVVRVGDATAKYIDTTADDADHFELNGVDKTASYKLAIAAGNQGAVIQICYDGGTNEFVATGDLEWTDSGAD